MVGTLTYLDTGSLPFLPGACSGRSRIFSYVANRSSVLQSRYFHPRISSIAPLRLGCRKFIRSRLSRGKSYERISVAEKKKSMHIVRCSGDEAVGSPIPDPKYHSYIDPSSGEPAPVFGNRTNLPDAPFWAEDMARISRMAQASVPDESEKDSKARRRKRAPGSGRRKFSDSSESSSGNHQNGEMGKACSSDVAMVRDAKKELEEKSVQVYPLEEDEDDEDDDEFRDEYVTYEPEEQEEIDDISYGAPHALLQQKQEGEQAIVPTEKPLSNEELWWNWREFPPGKEPWSAWHKRPGDSDTVMAAAMAEIGQIKLFGKKPTIAEATLARARKYVFYQERLSKEEERKREIGPMAYYQEWVKAWKKDTSKEAVQKHFKKTGENVSVQLLNMFQHQTQEEYRHMMGTDVRIQRDPLTMRMREEQKKQVWGGDPVYPTINYVQDPDLIIDYRGPNFHEPMPDILDGLRKAGRLVKKEEIQKIQQEEKAQFLGESAIDDAMAAAVDIGDKEDGDEEEEPSHPWRGKGKKFDLKGQIEVGQVGDNINGVGGMDREVE